MAEDIKDVVVAELIIKVHSSGAMSVAGCIEHEYALKMLDAARESIKTHVARKALKDGGTLILPPESSLSS